jgi:hydrogenase small subunit
MKEITRREYLKRLYQVIVGVGAGPFISFEDILAAGSNKAHAPAVVWLHGTSCTGCSCSLLNIEDVSVVDLITEFMKLVFHHDLSAATGSQVASIIHKISRETKGYIFVFEGGIPVKVPHACLMADEPISHWVDLLASNAAICMAAGTCSSFGGIPKMTGTVTGSMSLNEYLQYKKINVPVVNLPNCPMKPEHLVYTLLHQVKFNRLPELDSLDRPTKFFNKTVHQRCIYYRDFQENNFAEHIGDDGCLFRLGCQGPITNNDCMILGHNSNTNTCIKSGHPCVGCAGMEFPRKIMFHQFNDTRYIGFEKTEFHEKVET